MSGTESVSVDVETLNENISELKYELAHYKTTNEDLVSRLAKAERQLSKVNDYNEELRIQLETLSKEVHQYRKTTKLANEKLPNAVCTGEIGVQVCADDFEIVFESKALPSWDTEEKREDNVIDTSCIADALKATAEAALYGQADSTTHIGNQTGKSYDSTQYVYDETSQMYYDYNSGYYIDTQNNLYYDPKSGTYFYYDTTTQTYEFHSQIDISKNPTPTKQVEDQSGKIGRRSEKRKTPKKKMSTDIDEVTSTMSNLQIQSQRKNALEASVSWPPCIRAIVQVSDCLDVGDLSVITCTGGTVGREKGKNHVIIINDLNISRNHCSIWFDYDNNNYMIKDEGSQHGTYINTTRLSQPNTVSHEAAINHGDTMKVGSTEFLLHIHPGNDTCLDCEPGEVKARVKKDEPNNIVILSVAEKKKQKKAELNTIKKRYGLKNMAYENNDKAINNPAYEDKAAVRRKKVGSDGPGHKAEAPASVHKPISGKNVGHKLLSKMGWKEGEGLGKSSSGIVDPINVNYRSNKAAGLGSSVSIEQSIDNIDGRSVRKVNKWRQAQERYDKIDETLHKISQDSESQNEAKVPESESKTVWVKGDTQNLTEQSENT